MNRAISYLLTFALGASIGIWVGQKSDKAPSPQLAARSPSEESCVMTPSSLGSVGSVAAPSVNPIQGVPQDAAPRRVKNKRKLDDIYSQKEEFEERINQDDLDGAALVLRRMETTASRSRQYLESRSRLLVRQRGWEDAKVALKQCLEAYPASKSCLIDLSSTELQIGSKEEQEKAITSCLSRSPKDPQCRNMLAILKMNQGKFDEAVSVYRQLLKDNGGFGFRFDEGMLNWQLAIALEGAEQLQEALTHFDKACRNHFGSACKKYEEVRAKL